MWSEVRAVKTGTQYHTLTGNGAADFAPPRSNTGTVPDHAVLGSLISFSHSVVPLVDFIVAPFLFKSNSIKDVFGTCFVLFSDRSEE